MDVADEEMARRREALRELGVDQLVDHDPRRDDPARQAVAEDRREDDESDEPEPDRNTRQRARCPRRLGLGPAVAREVKLVEPFGQLGRERRAGLDPDLCSRSRHLVDDRVGDDRPAGGLLEGGGIPLGDLADVVLAPRVLARGIAHRMLRRLAGGQELERSRQGGNLVLVDGNLERDLVGKLREPPEVADDERPPE